MRQIMMYNSVSADGYFSGPEGGLEWAVQDPELEGAAASSLSGTGTMLFGRRTYDMFESFWPRALDDSPTSPAPHGPERRTRELRAMAVWINDSAKIVFSRTRKAVSWKNSELVREFDPRAIAALKNQPGKNIIVFGSGSLVSQLTEHGLIDEYQFVVHPVLLGGGKSLLNGVPRLAKLTLAEARPYPSGIVKLRYTRAT